MRLRTLAAVLVSFVLSLYTQAQSPELSKTVKEFVRVGTPKVVLTHVRVIDGTGTPAGPWPAGGNGRDRPVPDGRAEPHR